jgi:uncharacterized protein YjdB
MLAVFTLMTRNVQAAVKVNVEGIEIVGNDVLAAGKSTTYKANVTPSNATNKAVVWSVAPDNSGATITAAGALKIDAKCTLDEVEVIATSKDNNEIIAKRTIAINRTAIKSLNVVDENQVTVVGKSITLYRTKVTKSVKTDTVVSPKIVWVNEALENMNRAYLFTSSNENIVTVDQNGHISATGNGLGTAVIKCQAIDGTRDGNGNILTKTFSVKVIEPADNVEITGDNLIAAGRQKTYKATVTPANVVNKAVVWSVAPENSGATITAAGALKIDAKCTLNSIEVIATSKDNNEILAKKRVEVNGSAIKNINVLDDKGVTVLGKTITLYRTKITDNTKIDTIVTPSITWVNENAIKDYKPYKFISSNENIVTVDQEGHIQVTGNTTGKATIKCQAIDGTKDGNGNLLTKSFVVNVIEPIEHVEVKGNELVGGLNSVTYKASVFPANATNKKLVWNVYPENKGVNISQAGVLNVTKDCQIDSVKVLVKAAEDSAVYATMDVAINKAGVKVINFDDSNGKRVAASVNLYRVKATDETPIDYKLNTNITWKIANETGKNCPYIFSSSDERIATVDQSGHVVVTGEMTGKCTIKCVAIDGSKNQDGVAIQKSVVINVTNPLSKLELSIPDGRSKYVAKGRTIKLAVKKIADYGATPAKTIKFTSSNVSVATVDGNGVVTFKADSYSPVTITATVNDDTKLSESFDFIATNVIKNIQLGYIPSDRANTNKISMLEVSDAPIEFPLTFNAPDQASASIKTVCPEFTVTSNMPEYIETSFENGIVKLWPKKEILNKNVEIIIKPKDGTTFSAKWLFRVEMPEELVLEEYDVPTLLKNSVIIDVFNNEDEPVVIEEIEEETSENIPSDAESDSEELTDEYREDESIEEETGDMD